MAIGGLKPTLPARLSCSERLQPHVHQGLGVHHHVPECHGPRRVPGVVCDALQLLTPCQKQTTHDGVVGLGDEVDTVSSKSLHAAIHDDCIAFVEGAFHMRLLPARSLSISSTKAAVPSFPLLAEVIDLTRPADEPQLRAGQRSLWKWCRRISRWSSCTSTRS